MRIGMADVEAIVALYAEPVGHRALVLREPDRMPGITRLRSTRTARSSTIGTTGTSSSTVNHRSTGGDVAVR